MGSFSHAEGQMRQKLTDIGVWTGFQSLWVVILAIGFAMVLDLGTASAQTSPTQQTARPVSNKPAVVTSGSGQYYFEFRSRQAWDYGHTFVVFGRVGEPPSRNNVAGLSPKGDDPQMWLMGHYVPVPSDTGWTDGDLEDKYITSRYRVLVSKELYNCNAFVADIANFMGLKAPSSTWIYPKVFVTNMRKINTGHPEAATELVSENVKEMNNPTRDGRAMIASGMIHPENAPAGSASPVPNVTIGAVHVTNRAANSAGGAQHSP